MSFNIAKKAKGFITNPVESFRQSREDKPGDVIKYFVVLLTVFATFSSFIRAIGTGIGNEIGYFIGYFVVYFIAGFIGLFVSGAAIYIIGRIIGRIIGGRIEYFSLEYFSQIPKVLIYSSTPVMLLGWIPWCPVAGIEVVRTISGLWAIIILILGIRELYQILTVDAVMVFFVSSGNAFALSYLLMAFTLALYGDGDDVLRLLQILFYSSPPAMLLDWILWCPLAGIKVVETLLFQVARVKALILFGLYLTIVISLDFWESCRTSTTCERQKHPGEDDLFFGRSSTTTSQTTGTLQRIETGLQRMKAVHPVWMERPEFAPLVNNIQENLIDPSKYGDTERLYMQLESQVEQIEQSVNDLDRLIGGLNQLRK